MTALDTERFERMLRERLVQWQAQALTLDASLADVRAARSDGTADDEHDPEGSTLSSDWSQLSGLSIEARQRIEAIERASTRIRHGTYGICLGCGRAIPVERLEVHPAAEHCVPCASGARPAR